MSFITEKNKYIAFTVLIGGKSRRFGSDKGIFEFKGKLLVEYQLEVLYQFPYDVYLVAHDKDQLAKYQDKIKIPQEFGTILDNVDKLPDNQVRTPMIGIYSAFKELAEKGYEKVFTLSCDMPLINHEIIDLIIRNSRGYDAAIPKWNNGFLEPLFAIYPTEKTLYKAKKCLESKNYKLLNLLSKKWDINYISIEKEIEPIEPTLYTFTNINNPIDLEKLMDIYEDLNK